MLNEILFIMEHGRMCDLHLCRIHLHKNLFSLGLEITDWYVVTNMQNINLI